MSLIAFEMQTVATPIVNPNISRPIIIAAVSSISLIKLNKSAKMLHIKSSLLLPYLGRSDPAKYPPIPIPIEAKIVEIVKLLNRA